jgi:hypothetical protein
MRLTPRTIAAVAICLVGLLVAARALWRTVPAPASSAPERDLPMEVVEARAAMADLDESIRRLSDEERESFISGAPASVLGLVNRSALSADLPPRQVADLGVAFQERATALLAGDFERNVHDLTSRGWPSIKAEDLATMREHWRSGWKAIAIDPEGLRIREHDAAALESAGGLKLDGYGMIEVAYEPHAAGGAYSQAGERVVEVSFPARISDINGRPVTVILGYVFTWNAELERWRVLRTVCHYADPEAGPMAAPPLI